MVVSTIALFVALGGTGYAAVKLPAKSVGSKQLKASAVTSDKVKNGSLTAKDFKSGQLKAGKAGVPGPAGPSGPQGVPGATGAQGPQGATGAVAAVVTRSLEIDINSGQTLSLLPRCNADEVATGGGATFADGNAAGGVINRSAPHHVKRDAAGEAIGDEVPGGENSADGWTTTGTNGTGSKRTFRAFVLCIKRP
ncbi:collagen-like protein [Patulibacter sp. NPDC049589]|uniref:collagen-like triple helix repeat-containing protein n=1 Tax=Patulibacter sp. NPDC049589 TaxID=3154731 RepID=UPI00341F7F8F